MATLSELREKVRSQTQTTNTELSDSEIDSWLQEAFNRTIAAQNQWPFFESTWNLTLVAGDSTVALPTSPAVDHNGIMSLVDTESGDRLKMVDYAWAEDAYTGSTVSPVGYIVYFSIWGDTIYLWPSPDFSENRTLRLRGFRRPADWIASGASAEPDCDERLHLALANYAISLAYAQQEDPELENVYMQRWQRDVEIAVRQIMEPAHHRPLMMGPRIINAIGRMRY